MKRLFQLDRNFEKLRGIDFAGLKSASHFMLQLDICGAKLDENVMMFLLAGARFYKNIFRITALGIYKNDEMRKAMSQDLLDFALDLFKGQEKNRSDLFAIRSAFERFSGYDKACNKVGESRLPEIKMYGNDAEKYRECMLRAIDRSRPDMLVDYFRRRHLELVRRDLDFVSFLTGLVAEKAEKSEKYKAVLEEIDAVKRQDLNTSMFLN